MDLSDICDITDTGEKEIAAEYRDAIAFKADFDAADGQDGLTYFGGRPCLPPDLLWPELERNGASHALTFLGQVDLADIAALDPAGALPPLGVLYFFLDTNILNEAGLIDASLESGLPWRVLYSEAGASHREPAVTPPHLMPCFGYPYAGPPSELNWIGHVAWRERYYAYEAPRIPMQPLALRSFPIRDDSEPQDQQRQRAAWIDTFGQPVARKGFAGVADDRRGELFLLAQFPATNIYLEIFAGGLLKNILGPWENQKLRDIGIDHVPAIRRILAEIDPANLFASTSPDQQDRLLSIMHDLAERDPAVTFTLNRLLRTAYFWGSSLSLSYSARTAKMAPDELVGITRELFYPLHGDADQPDHISCTLHQMLGHGTEVQGQVQGQVRARTDSHVMLMQFDSDNGFGWMFGDCGVAQFWITPEDLAECRFDRVTATVDGS